MSGTDKYDENSIFSKESFDCVKGYLALCILLHHIFLFNGLLTNTFMNYPQYLIGHWAVVLFMFISGFGLYESYKTKGRSYITSLPKHRLLPFYLTYLVIILVYVIYYLINRIPISASLWVQTFTYGSTLVYYGWYFQLSFLMYVVFWILFMLPVKPVVRNILFILFAVFFTFENIIFSIHFNNFTPMFCFLFGMFVSVHKERIVKFLVKWKYPNFFFSLAIFAVFTILTTLIVYRKQTELYSIASYKVVYVLLTVLADYSLCMFMLCCLAIFNRISPKIVINPVSKWIGLFSLEIYALQGIVLQIAFQHVNIYAASVLSLLITIALAIPFHYLLRFILKPFKGANKAKENAK